MSLDPVLLVVVAANVLGGAMALPQAAKIVRTRRIDGVSAGWVGISTALNLWWMGYAVGIGDLAILPVGAVSVIAYLAIGVGILRFGASPRRSLRSGVVGAVGGSIVPATVLAIDGWAATGVALGLLYGLQLAPAVVAVYRAADVGGVAAATWVMAGAEGAMWIAYGLARADAGIVSFGATGLAAAALVLVRLVARRPRRSSDTGPLPANLLPA